MEDRLQVPLFPLPNVVHFPQTELRLHVFEPRYRQLVSDLEEQQEDRRWIGMVLLKPGSLPSAGPPAIFSAGTAGRLVEVEYLPDGRSNILLHGEFRFEVRREVGGHPYRQAIVELIDEPDLNEQDPGVMAVRDELVETSLRLAQELEARFPIADHEIQGLASGGDFERVVNRLAAQLDLPVGRKLELLNDPLPERALNVLGILRSRKRVLDLLRPFRHLADAAELN